MIVQHQMNHRHSSALSSHAKELSRPSFQLLDKTRAPLLGFLPLQIQTLKGSQQNKHVWRQTQGVINEVLTRPLKVPAPLCMLGGSGGEQPGGAVRQPCPFALHHALRSLGPACSDAKIVSLGCDRQPGLIMS